MCNLMPRKLPASLQTSEASDSAIRSEKSVSRTSVLQERTPKRRKRLKLETVSEFPDASRWCSAAEMLNITDMELLDQCRQALQEAGLEVPESSLSSPLASFVKAKLAPTNHEGASSNTVPLSKDSRISPAAEAPIQSPMKARSAPRSLPQAGPSKTNNALLDALLLGDSDDD